METRLGDYHLQIATDFGPRITGIRLGNGPQMFASLGPDAVIEHPDGVFKFHGGHRLWVAPEVPNITYASDENPCRVTEEEGSVTVAASRDEAGASKVISLSATDGKLTVEHRLTMKAPRIAPWAVTQLPLGGTAIIPFTAEDTSPLPNRHLVAWPYTSFADHRITFTSDWIEISAAQGPPLKLGAGLGSRRLGYFRDGYVFVKESGANTGGDMPDLGAARQVYVGGGFCEVETVDALHDLSDGGTAVFTEDWWIEECADLVTARAAVMEA